MSGAIGAVSYLNTKPLIYGLRSRIAPRELLLDLPSRLARRLAEGALDVALIPSVEFLRSERGAIISDACIACRGPVRSVQLLFRKPPTEVRTMALDEGSRTSAALAQVLLHARTGVRPELHPLPIDARLSSVPADALVVIGDRAMQIPHEDYYQVWDLGEQWQLETGLPFVFAMWVALEEQSDSLELAGALRAARDEGLANVETIIDHEAVKYGLTAADCRRYFMEQLHFTLGDEELAGLELFRAQAVRLGLIPSHSTQLTLTPL
jgi:chorismate dehydratase